MRLCFAWNLPSRVELHPEAEACFHTARAIATRQGAKWAELKATLHLSHVWQRQHRHREARQMLAEIYNWFTEGFDLKDLQEAKTLLEELAGVS